MTPRHDHQPTDGSTSQSHKESHDMIHAGTGTRVQHEPSRLGQEGGRWAVPAVAAALGVALLLFLAPPALAAPTLSAEAIRTPQVLHHNDEWASYEVKVRNSSSSEFATGQLSVFIGLPPGMAARDAEEVEGWNCDLPVNVCTISKAIPPEGYYPTLRLNQILIDETVVMSPTATFTVAGGGSFKGAVAKDSFSFEPAVPYGLESLSTKVADESGADYTQAGGHPTRAAANFVVAQHRCPNGPSCYQVVDLLKEGFADLPPGLIGNPTAVDSCTVNDLFANECKRSMAAGGVGLFFNHERTTDFVSNYYPIFKIVPEKGYTAEFGFKSTSPSYVVRFGVRTEGDFNITGIAPLAPSAPAIMSSEFIFCSFGVKELGSITFPFGPTVKQFTGCRTQSEAGPLSKPLVTMPTNCADDPFLKFSLSAWAHQGRKLPNGYPDFSDPNWKIYETPQPSFTGCDKLVDAWTDPETRPSFALQPDTHVADSPVGLTANIHVHNEGISELDGLSASHLRDLKVILPEGMTLNPSVSDGIEVCTEEQMGRTDAPGVHFDRELPHCPSSSKLGIAKIDTPLLENPLKGSVYLAAQGANPFGTDFAIYMVVEEPDSGVVIKLPGKVTTDPNTGQVTTTFVRNPQLPFEDFELKFFGGSVAALATPQVCGAISTRAELTPWAAEDPAHPRPDEIAFSSDSASIDRSPSGSACPSKPGDRPFNIGLSAGSRNPVAGARSPFSIRITRPDGNQEISKLEISPPPGFIASLKGIPYCSEAQIAAAASHPGRLEQSNPSCPAASEVGSTYAAAGAGPTPYFSPGKLYLAGPYKGQTLSVVAITPAVAGPFDLGSVVIRSALKVDPRTARVTAITDAIPQIVRGIPLRIRDIRIDLDRPGWARTPTNCEALSVDVTAYGSSGAIARPSNRYQVGGCENLDFKPKLSIHLKGGTKRGDHPALLAILSARPGDANIARAAVTLPPSAFLDQAHIRTICTRVQYAANACPAGAVYGFGKAVTDLLDDPIEGNVYLRSSDNKLPDLVAALKGVANIEAVGRIDSVHGGIRNTFDIVPDAPFETFTLKMQGGKKGLVVNSQNLCAKDHRATVKLTGQNGRHYNFRPKVIADGCAKGKQAKAKRQHRRHGSGGHS